MTCWRENMSRGRGEPAKKLRAEARSFERLKLFSSYLRREMTSKAIPNNATTIAMMP